MHHIPYLFNIAILLPVVWGMIRMADGTSVMALNGIPDAPALRMMVASLWAGVLVVSCLALLDPLRFWPVLVFQVIYKALFLILFCAPIWMGRAEGVVPTGPVSVFVAIIAVWPFFIVMAWRSGQM